MPEVSFRSEDQFELRLFLEELVCNLCRWQHMSRDGLPPEAIVVRQEYPLSEPTAFADVFVQPPDRPGYFLEVKVGYSAERLLESLGRKYGPAPQAGVNRLLLLADCHKHANWPDVEQRIRKVVHPQLEIDVWDEARLLDLASQHFAVQAKTIEPSTIAGLRQAVDIAKGRHALGDAFENDSLDTSLLWHFGYWRLKQIFEALSRDRRAILAPGVYRKVAILFADLSGFSGYVRDTRDERIVTNCLEAYYAKARYQIINSGGMLYQFLGDGVIGLFGVPLACGSSVQDAFECGRALLAIGDSVSNEWQRQIDRLQPVAGVHIGMALGDITLVPLRPFGRSRVGAIGDTINLAARLSSHAKGGQIVVSNSFYNQLSSSSVGLFRATEPVEARNVGLIRSWLYDAHAERPVAPARAAPSGESWPQP